MTCSQSVRVRGGAAVHQLSCGKGALPGAGRLLWSLASQLTIDRSFLPLPRSGSSRTCSV